VLLSLQATFAQGNANSEYTKGIMDYDTAAALSGDAKLLRLKEAARHLKASFLERENSYTAYALAITYMELEDLSSTQKYLQNCKIEELDPETVKSVNKVLNWCEKWSHRITKTTTDPMHTSAKFEGTGASPGSASGSQTAITPIKRVNLQRPKANLP